MADRSDITPELCRQLLRYEPETGKLYWLPRPSETCQAGAAGGAQSTATMMTRRVAGEIAGWKDRSGYVRVGIIGFSFAAHRVAWAIHYGAWPQDEIDHINGDKAGNRISNLRAVSRPENCRNRSRYRSNVSGVAGVCWNSARRRWQAQIRVAGVVHYLGLFHDLNDARSARQAAEAKYNFHSNHGR